MTTTPSIHHEGSLGSHTTDRYCTYMYIHHKDCVHTVHWLVYNCHKGLHMLQGCPLSHQHVTRWALLTHATATYAVHMTSVTSTTRHKVGSTHSCNSYICSSHDKCNLHNTKQFVHRKAGQETSLVRLHIYGFHTNSQ